MSEFERNTVYLYLYEKGQPVRNIGFLRRNRRFDEDKLLIHIRGFYTTGTETGRIYAITEKDDHYTAVPIGEMEIKSSSGEHRLVLPPKMQYHKGIVIKIQDKVCIGWYDGTTDYPYISYSDEEKKQILKEASISEERETKQEKKFEEVTKEKQPKDKQTTWNRLERIFPLVYPFEYPIEADYLSITPNEIQFFDRSEHVLMNNSFLQHAYYNYKYIILGKKHTDVQQEKKETTYTIGVPGIYHDREITMAKMFGFENFLNAKKEQPSQGCFGYYMKQVKLD